MKPFLIGIVAVALAAQIVAAQRVDEADRLLKAATNVELVDGNVSAAIVQYKAIVDRFGKTNRAVAATALLQMARAYEKLGNAESQKAYERLVRDYADQKEAVAIARSFLDGGLAAKTQGMVSRKTWAAAGGDIFGNISPDGRYIPYSDYDFGVILHDLKTGENRPLTDLRGQGEVTASETGAWSFSRDGKRLAYSWFNYSPIAGMLRVVDVDGPGIPPSRTLVDNKEISEILPHDWSPDGKWIAATVARADRSVQIALVSTADGSLRVLKTIDWRFPKHMYFSPDGKYLAFDLLGDVFVLAVDGSREIPAVVYPTEEQMAGWSPDGAYLLFTSDRLGSISLWASHIAADHVAGPPELIKRDLGERIETAGVTSRGGLYSVVYPGKIINNQSQDILRTTFDFTEGRLLSAPEPAVTTFMGTNRQPNWSSDGKYLAYLTRDHTIGIRSVDTGDTREVSLSREIRYVAGFAWAAKGASFLVLGTDVKGRNGIFRVDVETLRTTLIVQPESNNRGDVSGGHGESPDGKYFYYRFRAARTDLKAPPSYFSFIKRDLATNTETELIRRSNLGNVNLSPDGRFIATAFNDASTKSTVVLLVPTNGGEPREIMRDQQLSVQMWAPNSQSLFVKKGRELWRAPLDGGQPTKLDITLDPTWAAFRVHPDGRQIAIQTNTPAKPAELWALENFLPPTAAKK